MPEQETSKRFTWKFREFEEYQRGMLWYVIAGLVIGLLLVWGWANENYLFLLLVVITTGVLFLRHIYSPEEVTCEIGSDGITIGSKKYSFEEVDFFWVVEHIGDHHILYIHEKKGLRNTVPIPLVHESHGEIRTFLKQYLQEDVERNHEPLWDAIARRLKL
ncbi:MAG: hypothetical protein Q7R79_05315 [bacterium]|nr:hypothetical protein [bacterium]